MNPQIRNVVSLFVVIVICAVISKGNLQKNLSEQDPREIGDPNQMVVETRHSLPWHDQICVRRGKTELFILPNLFHWDSGSTMKDVFGKLDRPQFQGTFLEQDYYVWKVDVRYDWDFENKYRGKYLAVAFKYNKHIDDVTILTELPPGSEAIPADTEFELENAY